MTTWDRAGVPQLPRGASVSARGEDPGWLVLTAGGGARAQDRPIRLRRVLLSAFAVAVLIAAVIAVVGSLVSRHIAERQAVHDVAEMTDLLANSVVQPALTDRMLRSTHAAGTVLDPIVRKRVLSPSLVRVKLWRADGEILYSDEPRLVGLRFPLDEEARSSLHPPRTQAGITDLTAPENRYERADGKLLDVYRPVWTPSGRPLLFETYWRYDTVTDRSSELWRGFSGVMLSSLAALFLLLLPVAWLVLAGSRRARAQREVLVQRAVQASDEQRRHIASSLHDGVVQQLAGVAFTTAALAERARSEGDVARGVDLDSVAGTLRDSIAGLRSLLVDIYPPSLHAAGLAVALQDLTRPSGTGVVPSVDADADVAVRMSKTKQEAVFAIAQEALRNVTRHSRASRVDVSLRARGRDEARLEVVDNGGGFALDEVAGHAIEGHLGVRLMADAASRVGARLALRSAPGEGTCVRMDVALEPLP
jgi:two-component system, NarL family, sensor kinase